MPRRYAFLTIGIVVSFVSVSLGADDGEILLAERGGLQVVSIPEPSPAPGFVSTHIELRAIDPDAKLITWTNVKIEGRVHQTWLEGRFGQPTPNLDQLSAGPTYGEDWRALDSHLLLRNNMMGGCTGGCFPGISETNDGLSLAHRYLSSIRPQPEIELRPRTGFGNIKMRNETDAFWIQDPQTHTMPYAQIVTDYDTINGPGEVYLTFGVLGERIINSGEVGGATFGFDGQEPILVRFAVPEPNAVWWMWIWGFEWLRRTFKTTPSLNRFPTVRSSGGRRPVAATCTTICESRESVEVAHQSLRQRRLSSRCSRIASDSVQPRAV